MNNGETSTSMVKKYRPLAVAAGIGSILGSGIIVGLSATITVWQNGLGLTNSQVGIISGALTFAIAIGSLLAGQITKSFGLVKSFNWLNLIYAIGALICVFSNNYIMLLIGVIITGLASGADLPISLTVVSHDAPDDKTSASLVSSTQIFWQIGVFMSYVCAFIVSKMAGASGARIVFSILAIFALITWAWRTFSTKFRAFHEEGEQRRIDREAASQTTEKVSIKTVFAGANKGRFMAFFFSILIFYVCWNLLANTFGQFQTFTLVQAHASQSFATGAGIVLNFISLLATMAFASVAGGKYRNKFFLVGITVQFLAMLGLAMSSHSLWAIVITIGCYNIGNNIAGEAMYKVWTQEAFPVEVRASVQGFINGFSRVCCGLFALITPALVVPSAIRNTMFGFAAIVFISFVAGLTMMRLEKKHGINNF
ncbi:MFS transporter [Lactiplantibacillus plantarum]|uniref:MFS transporter n=1 Tax=Lactiplantibacillus plantarum TaxID=1590 RepID=UPI0007BAF82E|nr:MFS transporter [Lactiplantibacillus plantarum]AYE59010.1 MFS transporter [Lactiplantibacillus plantarum]KZU60370.1 putative L-rhamnose permease RhaY [Lactiplantibacillus plantarum]MCG0575813.1 sugar transport protein [Lactiplantibacillus plantarum]MCG0731874.1 sugar transport protein [Lactiplantibacillus plantarum]MCG0747887.1 sugar transport protein [Lactiplantibacillus plantarum]